MTEHSLYYYPYATFGEQQELLLKAAALYFDKLHILDPINASLATVKGSGKMEANRDLSA